MTLQPIPSEFPYICGQFYFLFFIRLSLMRLSIFGHPVSCTLCFQGETSVPEEAGEVSGLLAAARALDNLLPGTLDPPSHNFIRWSIRPSIYPFLPVSSCLSVFSYSSRNACLSVLSCSSLAVCLSFLIVSSNAL
jgi:hypothetical protein